MYFKIEEKINNTQSNFLSRYNDIPMMFKKIEFEWNTSLSGDSLSILLIQNQLIFINL